MNTLARRIATPVAALALAATAAGCANTPTATPTADAADSQAALDALNNAREITATKSLISWGDEWVIEVDGQQVGTVTGQAIYAIGDVYSLTATSGNLVASETEELNAITHTATLYDWDNKETGRLEERVLALTPTVDIIHTNGGGNETVGTATNAMRAPRDAPQTTLPLLQPRQLRQQQATTTSPTHPPPIRHKKNARRPHGNNHHHADDTPQNPSNPYQASDRASNAATWSTAKSRADS